jgi:hypothetical protein
VKLSATGSSAVRPELVLWLLLAPASSDSFAMKQVILPLSDDENGLFVLKLA